MGSLPVDPINTTSSGEYYSYATGGSFKLGARLESEKHVPAAGKDGGPDPALYEKGTDLNLAPFMGGMVGWWKFDEGSGGTASDSSGSGETLQVYNLVNWVNGISNTAVQIDLSVSMSCVSQNAGVYTSSITDSIRNLPQNSFSQTWWAKSVAGATLMRIGAVTIPGCGICSIWHTVNYIWIRTITNDNSDIGYTTPSDSNWHHYAFVFDKINLIAKMYIDGVKQNQSSLISGGDYGTVQELSVGVYSPGCVDATPGAYYDEYRIYSRGPLRRRDFRHL